MQTVQIRESETTPGKFDFYIDGVRLNGRAVSDPEHAAARALVSMGYDGPFQTMSGGKVRMTYHSAKGAAGRMISEAKGSVGLVEIAWTDAPTRASEAPPDD
jgi:hypothetical protein